MPSFIVLFGVAGGLMLEASLELSLQKGNEADPSNDGDESTSSEALNLVKPPGRARPTATEVLQSSGADGIDLLLRYLKDATIEEVIALMNAIVLVEKDFAERMWMIKIRGVKLDLKAMLAWSRLRENVGAHVSSVYQWGAMTDHMGH